MPGIDHLADHTGALRAAGLRVTAPRLATLEAVASLSHPDADTIALAVRERLGTVSRQAVYDVLGALTEVGLLRRVSVGTRSMRYELHRHDNHHHVVCTRCGRLEDVPCVVGEAPCLDADGDHGFQIDVADVVFRGTCSDCRAAATSSAETSPAGSLGPRSSAPAAGPLGRIP